MMLGSSYLHKNLEAWRTYIPPTQAALTQHIKRASYQSNCWNMAMTMVLERPNPKDWGWWKDDTGWHPLWITFPEATKSCSELIRCG